MLRFGSIIAVNTKKRKKDSKKSDLNRPNKETTKHGFPVFPPIWSRGVNASYHRGEPHVREALGISGIGPSLIPFISFTLGNSAWKKFGCLVVEGWRMVLGWIFLDSSLVFTSPEN